MTCLCKPLNFLFWKLLPKKEISFLGTPLQQHFWVAYVSHQGFLFWKVIWPAYISHQIFPKKEFIFWEILFQQHFWITYVSHQNFSFLVSHVTFLCKSSNFFFLVIHQIFPKKVFPFLGNTLPKAFLSHSCKPSKIPFSESHMTCLYSHQHFPLLAIYKTVGVSIN